MRQIRHVAVLGANGTMGALSGGIFAQAGCEVAFVSRSREKSQAGIDRAVAAARSEDVATRSTAEVYENLPAILQRSDWIFEALGEDLDLKREFYTVVDAHRREDAIVSTVSSGLSIAAMAQDRSAGFRRHFLGTHFYNPPAKLPACELISHSGTDAAVLQFAHEYLAKVLRRVVVPTRDVPAFAGNRIGFQFLNQAARLTESHSVLMVDTLLGPYTGRALPPLATIDLVGLDVHRAIVDNVFTNAHDECRDCFRMPEFMRDMITRGQLGRKSPAAGGFYGPKQNGHRPVWNPKRAAHEAVELPRFEFMEEARRCIRDGLYREALAAVFAATGDEARLVQRSLAGYVHYAFARIGDVTEAEQGIAAIDDVMAYGFSWAPPGGYVDLLGGPAAAAAVLERSGFHPPASLMRLREGMPVCRVPDIGRFFVA